MEIGVNLVVKLDDKTKYDMGLDIPTEINKENPFHFQVIQEKIAETKDGDEDILEKEVIMQVVFGDKEHIYAKVQPPRSILELAKVNEYIDSFEASVKEGTYNEDKGNFEEIQNNKIEDQSKSQPAE